MIRNSRGAAIGIQDMEDTTLFFIQHMTPGQRTMMMAERPGVYSRLFPEVPSATITTLVSSTVEFARTADG